MRNVYWGSVIVALSIGAAALTLTLADKPAGGLWILFGIWAVCGDFDDKS